MTGSQARHGSYAALWAAPGARSLAVTATFGRLPLAMNALGLLLLLKGRDGLGAAALVVSVYTLAFAAAGPFLGRVADDLGPRRVLIPTGLVHPLALLAVVAVSRAESTLLVVLVAVVAGATVPPGTAVARAAWPRVTRDERVLATAFATDAVMTELVWIAGPVLTGVIAATAGPRWVVLTAAGFALVGTLGLARHPAVAGRPVHAHTDDPPGRVLSLPSFRLLISSHLAMCTGLGMMLVAIPAYAPDGSTPGLLTAAWGVGSAIAGVVAGRLARRASVGLLAGTALVLAGLILPLAAAAAAPAVVVALLLAVAGAPIAPFNTVLFQLVSAATPARLATAAFAWVNTVSTVGMSAGAGLAGVLLPSGDGPADSRSLAVLYLVAAAVTAAAAGPPLLLRIAAPVSPSAPTPSLPRGP